MSQTKKTPLTQSPQPSSSTPTGIQAGSKSLLRSSSLFKPPMRFLVIHNNDSNMIQTDCAQGMVRSTGPRGRTPNDDPKPPQPPRPLLPRELQGPRINGRLTTSGQIPVQQHRMRLLAPRDIPHMLVRTRNNGLEARMTRKLGPTPTRAFRG